MARSRISPEFAKVIRAALDRYRRLAITQGAAADVKTADQAPAALRMESPALRGRPRAGAKRGHLEWRDDPELEPKVAAILRKRRFNDEETLTEAVTALQNVASNSFAKVGKVLTKDDRTRLRDFAPRRNVEAREIATFILARRSNVGIREAKQLRSLPVEALIHR